MNTATLILTAVLILNLFAPFAVYYAIGLAKEGLYKTHKRIQNAVFIACVLGVLTLEGLIRFSGGSGSLAENSSFSGTTIFKTILAAHIIGAILTYILWTFQIVVSNRKFGEKLLGSFASMHKTIGYILFLGLIYTAVTAAIVCAMVWL
ncbi:MULTISPECIES: DUF420 domain-containing protein [Pirellulaceae]|uniref:DUF420 domain-containing protein n=2 Tax=Pirellulaceae TaxID=2691357 RepID=A0A518ITS8_9BACT|nr:MULTISPECIES: DUF420 domain-containing protein [Pirellulaceae]EMB14243.1 hypothetical protein RE6C_05025 [Rhodopirellula europaea 6C]QDV56492.1 hypothetical protein Mal33_24830 [Rosistilla oblonga]